MIFIWIVNMSTQLWFIPLLNYLSWLIFRLLARISIFEWFYLTLSKNMTFSLRFLSLYLVFLILMYPLACIFTRTLWNYCCWIFNLRKPNLHCFFYFICLNILSLVPILYLAKPIFEVFVYLLNFFLTMNATILD
jgi:hypothetical protein